MHRRNRHIAFSAKNAGAVLVLDARTIKNVSSGSTFSSWTDLSASSRNFAGTASRFPTYLANIQGGQPVVRFDATANSALGTTMSVSWLTSENPSRYVWIGTEIPRTINANRHLVTTDDGSFNTVNFSLAHTTTNAVGTNVRPPSTDFYAATVSVNTPYVQSLGYDGNQLFFYRGNSASATGITVGTTTKRICLVGRLTG